jgi:hypothetical protein
VNLERRPGPIAALSDDQLGSVSVSLVVGELTWSPDVAPAVLDRISRDAVAYPDHFDRRPTMPSTRPAPPAAERSAKRAISRLAVFAVILVIIIGLVAFAATASAANELVAGVAAIAPIRAIDGTLVSFGGIAHIVSEAS